MPISSKLLTRAYQLADSGEFEDVAKILEAILAADPRNIEAWEYYLQICTCLEDLDWLADRVQSTEGLTEDEKVDILEYYNYRADKLEDRTSHLGRVLTPVGEEQLIIPTDIHEFEQADTLRPGNPVGRFSWISSKNVVPLTLVMLIVTYILDKTIPNNGLIGFFIVLALSFLYIYWLTTAGLLNLPPIKSRSFAKDIKGIDEMDTLVEWEDDQE